MPTGIHFIDGLTKIQSLIKSCMPETEEVREQNHLFDFPDI